MAEPRLEKRRYFIELREGRRVNETGGLGRPTLGNMVSCGAGATLLKHFMKDWQNRFCSVFDGLLLFLQVPKMEQFGSETR